MHRKLNAPPLTEDPPYLTNDRPAILGRRKMRDIKLPPDFDLTYHQKVLASGNARATTQEEFQAMIAELKKQLKK